MTINQRIQLHDGNTMPLQGLGLYKITNQEDMTNSIHAAWQAGYRLFDTAQLYKNEDLVGNAFQSLNIKREELFLTTKITEPNQGYYRTLQTFTQSLKDLKLDYVDLLLVHWPLHQHFFDTWKAFERLKSEGLVKSIGVSNYGVAHLQLLATQANEMPVLNQVELHPKLSQKPLLAYHQEHNIVTQAWSPLGRARNLDDEILVKIAHKYQKSAAQIILRWHVQNGVSIIPKSIHDERIIENANLYDFELTQEDMELLDSLNRFERLGEEPEMVYEYGDQYPH